MNKVILMGRMTKEPELKTTQGGTSVVSFSLAVQKRFKDANGEYGVDFIECVSWRTTAEFIHMFIRKGQLIGVVGSIQTRTYQTQNGENRKVTEILVEEAYFCGEAKKQTETAKNAPNLPPNATQASNEGFIPMPANDDDLPF